MRDHRAGLIPPIVRSTLRWHGGLDETRPRIQRRDLTGIAHHGLTSIALGTVLADVDDPVLAGLERALEEQQSRTVALEAAAVWVIRQLRTADVEARILKGLATSSLDHEIREDRGSSDIDLLVRTEQLPFAIELLQQFGLVRPRPEFFPGYDERFGKGATMVLGSGAEVDLHRMFIVGPFGQRVPSDELWGSSQSFDLGGETVKALTAEHRYVHALVHFGLSEIVRAHDLLDLRVIHSQNDLDPEEIIELVERWRVGAAGAMAVRLSLDTVGAGWLPQQLEAWATTRATSMIDRLLIESRVERRKTKRHRASEALAGLTWSDRLRYVRQRRRKRA